MAQATKDVTDASFAADVLQADRPVLVDFWATWCRPCRQVMPVLQEIAGEHADVLTVAMVDIDANPGVVGEYRIASIPTMILFAKGRPVKMILGAGSKDAIMREVSAFLP